MFDERAFISQVERANPEELAKLLIRPTFEEEKALRAHLDTNVTSECIAWR
jgi:hypothetical protein